MANLVRSSIGRKFAMALSALFLMSFLLMHFSINLLSVFSEETFNTASHFMGTNPLIQYVMQPILIFGVLYHFIMGFYLEIQNRKARGGQDYMMKNGSANSTWMSRNMIWSGLAILAFLLLHFIDFWFPEIQYKYICQNPEDVNRYYHELAEKFHSPIRVIAYVVAFFFLMMHLLHGFQSAFQSMGANHRKYTPLLKKLGVLFAVVIPVGFMIIALFHYFNQ